MRIEDLIDSFVKFSVDSSTTDLAAKIDLKDGQMIMNDLCY